MTEQKKTNKIAKLLSAKTRMFTFLGGVVVLVIVVAVVWHKHNEQTPYEGKANVTSAPGILESVPAAGNPSNNYVKAQNIQNAEYNAKARKKATSSVPTITRASFVGNEDQFTNPLQDLVSSKPVSKECPLSKVVYMYRPNPANCTVPNLRLARRAGVTAEELRCQSCSCQSIRAAGYTAGEMKNTGFAAKDLKQCGYSLQQLIAAGFDAKALKAAGYNAEELRDAGLTAGQLAAAGFTADQLKAAGYSKKDLDAAGLAMAAKGNCSVSALKKARLAGVSAKALKACGVAALKAAGFTAKQLKDAGFSAAALKAAGFDPKQLKDAGFSAGDLLAAGFTPADLKKAGYSAAAIKKALLSVPKACSVENLKKERDAGVSATALRAKGCGLAALKAAGFTAEELKNAGFSAQQLKDAGFSAKDLKDAGFTAAQLKAAGYNAKQLKGAGYSAAQLKNAGFNAAQLKAAGFSAAALKKAGFDATQLRNAGYGAAALKGAGFDAQDLKNAGFSAGDLKSAGFSAADLKAAGFSAKALRNAGYGAADLKTAGFSVDQLKKAGFTGGDLLRAGFTPAESGFASNNKPTTPTTPVIKAPVATESKSSLPDIENGSQEASLKRLQAAQQHLMDQQQRNDAIQQMQGNMTMMAQKVMQGWSNPSTQSGQHAIEDKSAAAAGGAANAGGSGKDMNTGPTIKAGTVMYGVLDTSIDSDDVNTPVMARIVSGKLKGTKLLGKFRRTNKRLLMNFNTLNIPSFDKSISANVVAIDPRTARTVMSGYVNNHYLLRYGSLFASSFLSGLSSGVKDSIMGPCSLFFGCMNTGRQLKPSEYVMLGLGSTGTAYASHMASNFNLPPTVKIPGGVGIGLLFMSDVTLPQALPKHYPGQVPPVTHDDDTNLGGL